MTIRGDYTPVNNEPANDYEPYGAFSQQPVQVGSGGGNGEGMDERVTRLEEWAKLSDQRAARVEDKIDRLTDTIGSLTTEMRVGFAEIRANTNTQVAGLKSDLREEFAQKTTEGKRHQTSTSWTAAGVVGTILALLLTAYAALWPKGSPPTVATPAPQPIVIQLPVAPQPATTAPRHP